MNAFTAWLSYREMICHIPAFASEDKILKLRWNQNFCIILVISQIFSKLRYLNFGTQEFVALSVRSERVNLES